jgi:hypothetical protein
MALLVTLPPPVLAEHPASITVVAEGLAPFLLDMSLDEVRGRARDEARRNAIEQAVGVFVRGHSVLSNSQIVDELITAVARGVIEEEQWVNEEIQQIRDEKGVKTAGGVVAVYHVKVKAQVRPISVERRTDFALKASLNKEVFQQGEEALIQVHSTQPIYVHLFSVTRDGAVTVLLPNRFMTGNFLAANQDLVFPSEAMRSLGIRLRVYLPEGMRKAVEYIKVIGTKKPVSLIADHTGQGVFQTFDGTEHGMIQDMVKRLALLDDADWSETTLPYEVRK